MQPAIGACHEDIARAVVRPGAGHHLGAARDARPDVADVRLQRVPDIAAPLRPPRIVDGRAEILRNQLYDLVLETAAGLVREREIVGIGADAKRGGISGSGADHHGRRRYDDAETPAPLHGLTLVPGAAVCDAAEGAGTDSDFTYAARSQICCRFQDELPGRHAVRTALRDGLIDLVHPSAVAPMTGHQRRAHAAAAVEMAARTVHLAEQLLRRPRWRACFPRTAFRSGPAGAERRRWGKGR